jgi:hypothetical protein
VEGSNTSTVVLFSRESSAAGKPSIETTLPLGRVSSVGYQLPPVSEAVSWAGFWFMSPVAVHCRVDGS